MWAWISAYVAFLAVFTLLWSAARRKAPEEQAVDDQEQMEYLRRWHAEHQRGWTEEI